MVSITSILDDI